MPRINGKEFPYSPAGMAAAKAYKSVVGKKKDDDQKTVTKSEVLRDIPEPQMGETQGQFVKGQLGALDEGDRGQLNATNSKIARQFLVEFYRRWRAKNIAAARGRKIR